MRRETEQYFRRAISSGDNGASEQIKMSHPGKANGIRRTMGAIAAQIIRSEEGLPLPDFIRQEPSAVDSFPDITFDTTTEDGTR